MAKNKRNRFTAEYSSEHAIQRFRERYNVELTEKELQSLIKIARIKVLAGEYRTKEKNSNQYVLDLLYYQHNSSVKVLATFDTERDTITTFLPYIPPRN